MISVSTTAVSTTDQSAFVQGEEARREVRRHAPQRVLLVGLDMGKDVHMLGLHT